MNRILGRALSCGVISALVLGGVSGAQGNLPPACAAAVAKPNRIWPPDGVFRTITLAGVTDPDGDPVTLTVTALRQDEPLVWRWTPDATGLGTATPRVRGSRALTGDGRVYHITFQAEDGRGGSCQGTVKVCVPPAQPGPKCVDGGPLHDSTASPS